MTLAPSKTICFDFDGTLCTNTGGAYDTAEPFPWAIDRVNALKAAGYRIIIFTARGTATGIDWRAVTEGQLERWGVEYDELHLGKPSAAVYIDDRAVHTTAWQADDAFAPPGYTGRDFDSEEVELLPTFGAPPLPAAAELGRTFDGDPLRLDAHIGRLLVASAALGLRDAPPATEIRAAVGEALERAAVDDDVLFTITFAPLAHAGHLDVWRDDPSPRGNGLHVTCRPLGEVAAAARPLLLGDSVAAATTPQAERPPLAWQLVVRDEGDVGDGLGGQLAIVTEGRLVLEPPGPLPSIESGWALEVAEAAGIETAERGFSVEELREADEAAIVGFPFCVVPLGAVDGIRIGSGAAGGVVSRLREAWGDEAGVDLAGPLL